MQKILIFSVAALSVVILGHMLMLSYSAIIAAVLGVAGFGLLFFRATSQPQDQANHNQPSQTNATKENVKQAKELEKKSLFSLFNMGLSQNKISPEIIAKAIIKKMTSLAPDQQLKQGRLVKSKYTCQLEELVQDILQGEQLIYKEVNEQRIFSRANKNYHLTDILKYANLNHFTLGQKNLQQYEKQYVQMVQAKISRLNRGKYPTNQSFDSKDTAQKTLHLTYAEKLAIYVYTNYFYQDINSLLRGQTPLGEISEQKVKELILHIAFCASGLNKTPHKLYKQVLRYDRALPNAGLHERLEALRKGLPTREKGFISTTINPVEDAPVYTLLTGALNGHHVTHLSEMTHENEVLLLPTQLLWKGYAKENGKHFFWAEPVVTLTGLDPKEQEEVMPRKKIQA